MQVLVSDLIGLFPAIRYFHDPEFNVETPPVQLSQQFHPNPESYKTVSPTKRLSYGGLLVGG